MHEINSESFISPLYQLIFEEYSHCMYKSAKKKIIRMVDFFAIEDGTFIIFFGSCKLTHALPMLVMDILLMQEVFYQITTRFSKKLNKGKKKP